MRRIFCYIKKCFTGKTYLSYILSEIFIIGQTAARIKPNNGTIGQLNLGLSSLVSYLPGSMLIAFYSSFPKRPIIFFNTKKRTRAAATMPTEISHFFEFLLLLGRFYFSSSLIQHR